MPNATLSRLLAGAFAATTLAAPALGWAQTAPPSGVQPRQTVPEADEPAKSGSPTRSLSDKLDRSGGVIRPPAGVDAGADRPPPPVGGQSTPVIPPPGTPGGNPEIKPK